MSDYIINQNNVLFFILWRQNNKSIHRFRNFNSISNFWVFFITNLIAKYPILSRNKGNSDKSFKIIVTNSGLNFCIKVLEIYFLFNWNFIFIYNENIFTFKFSLYFRITRLSVWSSITIFVISLTNCWAEIPPRIFAPDLPDKLNLRIAANRTLKTHLNYLKKFLRIVIYLKVVLIHLLLLEVLWH
jgi:hypothetical protein